PRALRSGGGVEADRCILPHARYHWRIGPTTAPRENPMTPTRPAAALALLLAFGLPGPAIAQGVAEVKARYTKYEYRIPMRDGKRLFTAVYVPKDQSQTYPILLTRTPYAVGPYGADQYKENLGPSPLFGKAGYIFAYQDVRGRWMSEGEFVNMRPHISPKK